MPPCDASGRRAKGQESAAHVLWIESAKRYRAKQRESSAARPVSASARSWTALVELARSCRKGGRHAVHALIRGPRVLALWQDKSLYRPIEAKVRRVLPGKGQHPLVERACLLDLVEAVVQILEICVHRLQL